MRRKLVIAVGAVTLLVASFHVVGRVVGRRMLIARCAQDKGVLEEHGVFGNSRCVVGATSR